MRKILAVMLSVAMIFVMTACAGDSTEENGDGNQDLTEYRFSSTYVLVLRDKDEEDILNYDQAVEDVFGIDAQYGQEAHLEDNFLFIKATVEQKNALIDHNDELLKQFSEQLSQKNEAYKVEYSKDYSAMKIHMDYEEFEKAFSGGEMFDFGLDIMSVTSLVLANRVLSNADSSDCIEVEIINADSGFVVNKGLFPYESINMTYEDWQKSQSEDVTSSSELEGYDRIKATITEITDEKIIFEPADDAKFYADDDRLELCIDSVYADDVYLDCQLSAGEEVVLNVDGKYALHEDQDDIPDIAPVSVIPAKYFPEDAKKV